MKSLIRHKKLGYVYYVGGQRHKNVTSEISSLKSMKDHFSNSSSTILMGCLHPKGCFHEFLLILCKNGQNLKKAFFQMSIIFSKMRIKTRGVSQNVRLTLQIHLHIVKFTLRSVFVFIFNVLEGEKKAVIFPPSECFRPFSTTSF